MIRQPFTCLFLTVAMVAPVGAQQQPPRNIQRIAIYRIKPDRTSDFVAAVREFVQVDKKASTKRDYTTWASLTGDREFARVDLFPKFSELDMAADPNAPGAADRARLSARIADCSESVRTVIAQIDPQLTAGGAGYPPMIVVNWVRLHPGKADDFRAVLKSDMMPMIRKDGTKFFFVAQVAFGESAFEFEVFSGIPNWARLDQPNPLMSLGKEAYDRFVAKADPMTESREPQVYRFRDDLSYLPAQGSTTNQR